MCTSEKRIALISKDKEHFVSRSKAVHGDRYDYDESVYINNATRLEVRCREHGLFRIRPIDHYRGSGCQECATTGYSPKKHGYIYVLNDGNITKIGITNREVKVRVSEINKTGHNFKVHYSKKYDDGIIPKIIEKIALALSKGTGAKQPEEVFDGSTECFIDLDVDYVLYFIKNMGKILEEQE